jgi:hypothetical protein
MPKAAELLGKSLQIHLKSGGAFYFKCNEMGENENGSEWIAGHDEEGLNIRLNINDIAFVK